MSLEVFEMMRSIILPVKSFKVFFIGKNNPTELCRILDFFKQDVGSFDPFHLGGFGKVLLYGPVIPIEMLTYQGLFS